MSDQQLATDNFNRADGAIGSDWTQVHPGWGNVTISGNATLHSSDGNQNVVSCRWTGATAGSVAWAQDQYSQSPIAGYVWDNRKVAEVLVRASGSNSTRTYYTAYLYASQNSPADATTRIAKVVNGTYTELSSVAADGFAVNDILRIDAVGTTISVYKNGTLLRSVTDSAIDGTSSSAGVASENDSWEGGNVVSDAPEEYAGEGDLAPLPALVGSGSYEEPPPEEYAGDGDLLPSSALAGSGAYDPPEYEDVGGGAELLPLSSIVGSGTYDAPEVPEAEGAGTLGPLSTINGSGTYELPFVPEEYTGSGALVGRPQLQAATEVPPEWVDLPRGGAYPRARRIGRR